MNIKFFFDEEEVVGWVDWEWNGEHVVTQYKYTPTEMFLNRSHMYWQMAFCHELAHILVSGMVDMERYANGKAFIPNADSLYVFFVEHLVWRLAKSYCKPEYWDEGEALRCLHTYSRLNTSPPMRGRGLKHEINELNVGVSQEAQNYQNYNKEVIK